MAVQEVALSPVDKLITKFNLKAFPTEEERVVASGKEDLIARKKHQKELDEWFKLVGWRHIDHENPLEEMVYMAPRFIQNILEKVIPPEKIPGYHKSKHPFHYPFPKP